MINVNFKKLNKEAVTPTYSKSGDGCMDMVATSIKHGTKWTEYGTGLAFEIPVGYVGLVFPRSSISNTDMTLANGVGVIDAGYRGEVTARFKHNPEFRSDIYSVGDRICQIMIIPRPVVELVECLLLSDSERGEGGYGSTGA